MSVHLTRRDAEGKPIAVRVEIRSEAGKDPKFGGFLSRELLGPIGFHVRRFEIERTFVALVLLPPDEKAMGLAPENRDLDRWAHEAREALGELVRKISLRWERANGRAVGAVSLDDDRGVCSLYGCEAEGLVRLESANGELVNFCEGHVPKSARVGE